MPIAAFLVALAPSILRQVLLSLGMGVLTITGIDLAWGALQTQILSAIGALPASVIALCGLAGVGQAMGMILGAIIGRVTLAKLINTARIVGMAK